MEPIFTIPPGEEIHEGTFRPMAAGPPWSMQPWDKWQEFIDRCHGGLGVDIGILDTGINERHAAFKEITFGGIKDFTNSRNGTADLNRHGTHVCSIISRIAPRAKYWIAKVLGDTGSGSSDGILRGSKWLLENGVDVANASLGSDQSYQPMGVFLRDSSARWIFDAAAGNNNGRIGYPAANYPFARPIGAHDSRGERASFSSMGPALVLNAPGVRIPAADSRSSDGQIEMSGTSQACPFKAGVDACLLSWRRGHGHPDVTAPQMLEEIEKAIAKDVNLPGRDNWTGYGNISIELLLAVVKSDAIGV